VKRIPFFVVAALVVVVGGVLVTLRHRTSDNGPVFASDSSSSGLRLAVGQPVSFGHVLLRNRSKTPAKLESVRILGMTGGLELLGVRARQIPDGQGKGIFIGILGYPPPDWPSEPLEREHLIPVGKSFFEDGDPQEGLELVIGVRATKPGVARARAVQFTYTVGGRRYSEVDEGSMYLCAPVENFTADTCPGDAKGKFDEENTEIKIPN
jgi:hypothetical protein